MATTPAPVTSTLTDHFPPRVAALAAFAGVAVRPTSLVGYTSLGRLLVVGPSADVTAVAARLPGHLSPVLLFTDAAVPAGRRPSLPYRLCVDPPVLQGWLGAFQVAENRGSRSDIVPPLPLGEGWGEGNDHGARDVQYQRRHERHDRWPDTFDLVLDLCPIPLLQRPVLPPGYFAPHGEAERLAEALLQLAELVGEFDKPKYFSLHPELCAHHTTAVRGCQACLDVCGAQAIAPGDGCVSVTPQLCQGCGDCATACPSGAISYAYPGLADTLERLRLMLSAWRRAGGAAPVLLLHAENAPPAMTLPEWLLPYPLEALGAAGLEVWLSALAYGAAAVWLLDGGHLSTLTQRNLLRQLGYGNDLLQAMGHGADRLRLLRELSGVPPSRLTAIAAEFAGQNAKRTALRLALEHLHRHAPQPVDSVRLAEGAPFGQVAVDAQRCTLCLSCVSACPVGALQDGREQPQLRFIETQCVQCGRCAAVCPEQAVTLQPRYLFDFQTARQARLLHSGEAFHCVACGKPFADAAMIRTITAKLQHHPWFQGPAARRLHLCEDCRVAAHFAETAP